MWVKSELGNEHSEYVYVVRKIMTVCLRISLLPEGVWVVVSSFLNIRSD